VSFKTGELIKWMLPLDHDYSYGYVQNIRRSIAEVRCTRYYNQQVVEVHLKYIEKCRIGGVTVGSSKGKDSKRSAFISKVPRGKKY
jgi:hypothetical protein